jgi:hypothetical protein
MIPKCSRRDVYTREFRDVKDRGLVADVREVSGTGDILLMLVVDHCQVGEF